MTSSPWSTIVSSDWVRACLAPIVTSTSSRTVGRPRLVASSAIASRSSGRPGPGHVAHVAVGDGLGAGLHDVRGRAELLALEVALLEVDDALSGLPLERFGLAHRCPLLGQDEVRGAAREAQRGGRRWSPWSGCLLDVSVNCRKRVCGTRPGGGGCSCAARPSTDRLGGAWCGPAAPRARTAPDWCAPRRRERPRAAVITELGEFLDARRGDAGDRSADAQGGDDVAVVVAHARPDAAQALVVLLVVDRVAAVADALELGLQLVEVGDRVGGEGRPGRARRRSRRPARAGGRPAAPCRGWSRGPGSRGRSPRGPAAARRASTRSM